YAMYGYLYCQYFFGYAQYYGPACVGAAEAYFICLSQLPCEQFQVEGNCQTAYAAVADACGG
ncbi:MAG TPA: hypothetical protein VK034_17140, partial [Enhygromyxa sp.]|nr:hypothetical protein [Enhygromyxa sp.]